jgi:hypothetical protein
MTNVRAAMTERLRVVPPVARRPAPKRASRRALRAWAWLAGAVSFLTPTAILATAPRPAASAVPVATSPRAPEVIIHHVIRRVVVRAPTRVVTVGGSSQAPTVVSGAAAPAPPAASTGGSHP